MDRRKFIRTGVLGAALSFSAPMTLSANIGSDEKLSAGSSKLKLSFEPYTLQLRHAFNLASSQRTTTPGVQVRIEYDGLTGYGEASMPPYLGESIETVTRFLSRIDLSQFSTPFCIEEINDYMDSLAAGNCAAKASVDIALHDLCGKIMGQPWHRIWGLNPDKAPYTSFTVSYDADPAEMEAKIKDALPYRLIKVKMGLGHDKETVKMLRKYTDAPICVDANQGWTDRVKALDMCHWLADNGCAFVEQPLPKNNFADAAWLRERAPLPIIADEAVQRLDDIRRVSQAYDGINIKLMKCGGMHEAYRMAVLARGLGLKVMIGCMTETSCAVSAASQLSPMADWADLDGNLLITNDRFDGVKISDGKIVVPDRPGIGVELT